MDKIVTRRARRAAPPAEGGTVITREDSFDRVEQLKMAAAKLKVNLREVLFVGNMDNDAEAAQKAGCQFRRVK